MSWSALLKVVWVLLLAAALGWFSYAQLRPPALYDVTPLADAGLFSRLTAAGQVVGSGHDTIVVFTSYTCPYCAKLVSTIDSLLEDDPTSITVRFRHFVHPGVDSVPYVAAVAALCSAEQDRFREMSRFLFENQSALDMLEPLAAAAAVGIVDTAAFEDCLTAETTRSALAEDLRLGMSLRVTGTPTTFSQSQRISGTPPAQVLLRSIGSGL